MDLQLVVMEISPSYLDDNGETGAPVFVVHMAPLALSPEEYTKMVKASKNHTVTVTLKED